MFVSQLWLHFLQRVAIPLCRLIFAEPIKLSELQTRVFADHKRLPITEAIYVFQETVENQYSPLRTAAELWSKKLVKTILVCDGETDHGAAGFEFCKKYLMKLCVPEDVIMAILMPPEVNVNTLSEAQYLVRFAKELEWYNIFISGVPFHQLRAFMITVSVVLREYPDLKVYSKVGEPLNWQEHVRHSQGVVEGTRSSLIGMEYLAILRYQKKRDIVSCEEVLAYLDRRDQVAC